MLHIFELISAPPCPTLCFSQHGYYSSNTPRINLKDIIHILIITESKFCRDQGCAKILVNSKTLNSKLKTQNQVVYLFWVLRCTNLKKKIANRVDLYPQCVFVFSGGLGYLRIIVVGIGHPKHMSC